MNIGNKNHLRRMSLSKVLIFCLLTQIEPSFGVHPSSEQCVNRLVEAL